MLSPGLSLQFICIYLLCVTPYKVIANWMLLFQSRAVEMEQENGKKAEINFRIIHTQNLNFSFSHMWTVNIAVDAGQWTLFVCISDVPSSSTIKHQFPIFYRMFHGFMVFLYAIQQTHIRCTNQFSKKNIFFGSCLDPVDHHRSHMHILFLHSFQVKGWRVGALNTCCPIGFSSKLVWNVWILKTLCDLSHTITIPNAFGVSC